MSKWKPHVASSCNSLLSIKTRVDVLARPQECWKGHCPIELMIKVSSAVLSRRLRVLQSVECDCMEQSADLWIRDKILQILYLLDM